MKKIFALCLLLTTAMAFAQTPMGINYQGVARDPAGQPITNKPISVEIDIFDSTVSGSTLLFAEKHSVTTSSMGLYTLIIGRGTATQGTFGSIAWSNGEKWVKVGIDPLGGSFVTLIGRMPLMSVPFALYAKSAGNSLKAGNGISISNDSIHNTAPDQTVTLTGSGNVNITGTYPNFTIDGTKTLYHAGTGITISGDTIYNTAAQVPVSITGQGIQVSGSHPSFTLTAMDSSSTNELQALSMNNDTLYLSNGNQVYMGAYLDNTDSQTLSGSRTGSIVTGSISGGNSISFSVDDDDADSTNELQALSLSNDTLYLSNGNFVLLNTYKDNTDNQSLNKTGNNISLTNGGSVVLNDDDSLNEWQQISIRADTIFLSKNGGYIKLGKSLNPNTKNSFGNLPAYLFNDLIAFYPLNNNADDYTGRGNNGNDDSTIYIKDRFGNDSGAASFRSLGYDHITVPANDSLKTPDAFTVSLWTNSSGGTIFDYFGINTNSTRILIGSNGSDKKNMAIFDRVPNILAYLSMNTGWHHLVLSGNSGLLKLYIDGVKALEDNTSSAPGTDQPSLKLGYNMNGALDDVLLFNRVLADSEMIQLYEMGKVSGSTSIQTIGLKGDTLNLSNGGGSVKLPSTYATAIGIDTIALTLNPIPSGYATGMMIIFKANGNNSNMVLLNVNGFGMKHLLKNVSDTLRWGDIRTNQMISVIYDGTNFQMLSMPNLGKTYLNLTGDISDAEAATKILNDGGLNTQVINIRGTTQLTTLDLSLFKNLQAINIFENANLQSISFPNLEEIYEYIQIMNNPILTSINFSKLKYAGGVTIYNSNILTSVDFNSLQSAESLQFYGGLDQLASLNFSSFKKAETIYITNCNALTSLNLNRLQTTHYFYLYNNPALTSFKCDSLKSVTGSTFYISNTALTSIDLPSLISCPATFKIDNNNSLTSINCTSLKTVSTMANSTFSINADSALVSVNFSKLENIGVSSFRYLPALTTLSFPLIDTLNNSMNIEDNSVLTSASFSSLIFIKSGLKISNDSSLTSISHPSLKNFNSVYFKGNKLSSSTVNSLLSFYVNITPLLYNKSIDLSGQTPSAPPTGNGITDKATLIARPNTVVTD